MRKIALSSHKSKQHHSENLLTPHISFSYFSTACARFVVRARVGAAAVCHDFGKDIRPHGAGTMMILLIRVKKRNDLRRSRPADPHSCRLSIILFQPERLKLCVQSSVYSCYWRCWHCTPVPQICQLRPRVKMFPIWQAIPVILHSRAEVIRRHPRLAMAVVGTSVG